MKADLHTHTNASDGYLGREQLIEFSAEQGLSHIAITDHDTMKNSYRAPGDKVNVIEGVELSGNDPKNGRKVHMLCYLPKDTAPLEPFFEHAKQERNRAGEKMVALTSEHYPVVTMERVWRYAEPAGIIFKQHIMSVLIDYGYTNELYGDLFDFLFHPETGCCASADPKYASVPECVAAIKKTGGVFVMAHPSVYKTMELTRELARGGALDGIEVNHPRNNPEDIAELQQICSELGLLATTGTDYHARFNSRNVIVGELSADENTVERLYEISHSK